MASDSQVSRHSVGGLTRHDFPSDFIFGAATSAYQIEGGYKEDGKSLSNWDVFSMGQPGKILEGANGCIAVDHFNRVEEDVKLMKKLGIDAYRFSIAWSRILPAGRLSGGVCRGGVKFYSDLIDLLISQDIEPYVTLFHFDLPNGLELEYGGFLSDKIVHDFVEYAQVCFFEFGDRVKHWITQNEPVSFTTLGYATGVFPPGHGSNPPTAKAAQFRALLPRSAVGVELTPLKGDPSTEPYIVAHNLILAHAAAVDLYRKHFQAFQGGIIGVTNMSTWYEPLNEDDTDDIAAAKRAVDFMWGWFVEPLVTGDYPPVMREKVGTRLPKFTNDQQKLVKGSYDFIGMNYYTTNYAANKPTPLGTTPTYYTDQEVEFSVKRHGIPIGEQAGSSWLYVVPRGIRELLLHIKQTNNDPLIYITENGVDEINDRTKTITEACKDPKRIEYYQKHLRYVKRAIEEDGVNVKGYFLWSLFDNYEWASGYTVRFGTFYVDFLNDLARYPKFSAIWFMNFLNKKQPEAPYSKRQIEETEGHNAVKRIKHK